MLASVYSVLPVLSVSLCWRLSILCCLCWVSVCAGVCLFCAACVECQSVLASVYSVLPVLSVSLCWRLSILCCRC